MILKYAMFFHACIGPPPPPQHLTIQEETIGNFTISWSQSNCSVQYVVTIINSSDDRIYPNITTNNTNTTVTLPTGAGFCVTLVAVDSIGRRGPDTTPVCYQCELWCSYNDIKATFDKVTCFCFQLHILLSQVIKQVYCVRCTCIARECTDMHI